MLIHFSAGKVIENMSEEEDPTDRCEGLVTLPAEWHKKKVVLDTPVFCNPFQAPLMQSPVVSFIMHHVEITTHYFSWTSNSTIAASTLSHRVLCLVPWPTSSIASTTPRQAQTFVHYYGQIWVIMTNEKMCAKQDIFPLGQCRGQELLPVLRPSQSEPLCQPVHPHRPDL